jgi:hypothetical protein
MRPAPLSNRLIILAIVIAGIAYGALYPFVFRDPQGGVGPWHTLITSWTGRVSGTDFLANVLYYVPVGVFVCYATSPKWPSIWRILLALLAGAALSVGMELSQYYDAGRVTSANDVVADVLGTGLGALIFCSLPVSFRIFRVGLRAEPFAALLLAAWFTYRLYPFVPAVDLHKYWDAVKPLVFVREISPYELFRYSVMWCTAGSLTVAIFGASGSRQVFPLFVAGVLAMKILIVTRVLSLEEVLSAALIAVLWPLLSRSSREIGALALTMMLLVYIGCWRLEPFHFSDGGHAFGWLPFRSFMFGSVDVNTDSFAEKVFFYGSLLWAMTEAGMRVRTASVLLAAFLLLTSLAETHLPRSAETTDAAMALVLGLILGLVRTRSAGVPKVSVLRGRVRKERMA